MIAIMTKYIGASNTRGSRIKAFTCNGHQVTIGYDDSLNSEDAHKQAALKLSEKMGWARESWFSRLIGGGIKGGYCFVMVTKNEEKR